MSCEIDNTVYCDVMMPLESGVELLQLVNELRSSGKHPNLDEVFRHMQIELEGSICPGRAGENCVCRDRYRPALTRS